MMGAGGSTPEGHVGEGDVNELMAAVADVLNGKGVVSRDVEATSGSDCGSAEVSEDGSVAAWAFPCP